MNLKNWAPAFAGMTKLTLAVAAAIVPMTALADTINVVTSFPKDLTGAFKAAYEKKYSGDKLEILNKNTAAGIAYVREQGHDWPEERVRAAAPLVQQKIGRLGEFAGFAGFLFGDVQPDPELLDARVLDAAVTVLEAVDPWTTAGLEAALKQLCDDLGEKPRTVYLPIRVAATGSRVSPGLYESLELLGKETSLARLRTGATLSSA